MPILHTVGVRYDRLISVGGYSTSTDGYTWTEIVEPFLPYQSAIGFATDGITFTAVSDDGYVASSLDGFGWTNGSIIEGDLGPRAIRYAKDSQGLNGIFMLVGTQKYSNDEPSHERWDEVAQIFTSPNGNYDSWTMVYSQDDTESVLHGCRRIGDMWIACGASFGNPLLLYSLDNGFSWIRVMLPSLFDGDSLFDVTYANGQYFFSARGSVIYTPSLIDPEWNATDFVIPTYASSDFIRIGSNPSGHVVAAASGLIYYSLDGAEWERFESPGYQFTSVSWFNERWIVGCYSLLTKHTYFASTDTINWEGYNNSLHMYDFDTSA